MKWMLGGIFFILVLLIGSQISVGSADTSTLKIEGMVLDYNNIGIENARILVIPDSDDIRNPQAENQSGQRVIGKNIVTYSNKRGNWKSYVLNCRTFFVWVYSNGYETAKKKIEVPERGRIPEKINFVLKEGLSHIRWGSFEHLQLYVSPIHQKMVEKFIRAGNMKALDDYLESAVTADQKKYAIALAGYFLFENLKFSESRIFFEKAGSRLWFNLMGKHKLKLNQPKEALAAYLKGETTKNRADDLLWLAKKFEAEGDSESALLAYRQAVVDYQAMLNSFKYKWDNGNLDGVYLCKKKLKEKYKISDEDKNTRKALKAVLKKAAGYCESLNRAKIYYFCHEIKRDNVFLNRRLSRALENPVKFFRNYSRIKLRGSCIEDFYKYDLQFVKEENGAINENRTLLVEELDNSSPRIPVLSYNVIEPLHGPHTLIGSGWQYLFDYRIISEEKLFNEDTIVLEARQKMASDFNRMSGRLWINKINGRVLKIEWAPLVIQNRNQIRAMGFILEREPQLKFISEFTVEKNGLRFPSRFLIVESYKDDMTDEFERLNIKIDYQNYNFFMVSSAVEVTDE